MPQNSQAGAIPWLYDAIFGYHGPAFPQAGYGGMPWGAGYRVPMGGYPTGGFYGSYPAMPTYAGYGPAMYAPSMGNCSTGCSSYGASYAGGCATDCGVCGGIALSGSGCSPCGVQSQYNPPADKGTTQPTPATQPPPADGFVPAQPRDNDTVLPMENAPDWSAPVTPGPGGVPGKALKPDVPVAPDDDEVVIPQGTGAGLPAPQALPDDAPPVASTIAPHRRRTAFITGFRIPSVARVAVSPSFHNPAATAIASK